MVALYTFMIARGTWKFEIVLPRYQAGVAEALIAAGAGDCVPVEFGGALGAETTAE